jgi:3-deoxy-D-manno-octulosonic-acid transferase
MIAESPPLPVGFFIKYYFSLVEFLYSTGIKLYSLAARVAAPFSAKAYQWVEGRKGMFEQLALDIVHPGGPVAWFHCASLGEFEQARPVMEAFRLHYPHYRLLLTFFSPSGYNVRKHTPLADWVYYLPADTPQNAVKFVEITRPAIAFFVKYEFWHNYTLQLHNRGIPTISVSAIFRKNQLFFKPYGSFYRDILSRFDHLFVQNRESADLLAQIGLKAKTSLTGDTRFDRVSDIVETVKEIEEAALFKGEQPVLVIGSSWPEDMEVLIPFINGFAYPLKVIIAPHEIKETNLAAMEAKITKPVIRFSKATHASLRAAQVLIVDNIGMLSALYRYGDFAWVGGAFGKGLHNILEAATYGMPVFFGTNYSKFQEAKDLVALEAAFSVQTVEELTFIFEELYLNLDLHDEVATKARKYVQEQKGATIRIMSYVHSIIK